MNLRPPRSTRTDTLFPCTTLFRSDAEASPLASRLFTVPGVEGVFLGADFVTVTKAGTRDWTELKPALLGAIMEHFMTGLPVMASSPAAVDGADEQYDPADRELVLQIKELIDTRVRPAVRSEEHTAELQSLMRV